MRGHTRRIVLYSVLIGCAFAAACTDAPVDGASVTEALAPDSALSVPSTSSEGKIIAEESILPEPSPPREMARQGVVTAGDIDDSLNLAAFRQYLNKSGRELRLPRLDLKNAVRVQLLGPDRRPAPGVPVTLRMPGAGVPFYQGHSGVDGWITVFPSIWEAGSSKRVELRAFGDGQVNYEHVLSTGSQHHVTLPFGSRWSPGFLDLAFVFDTTGSMGDELAWLTKEFNGIVQAARRSAPGANIRFGLIAYRDKGDAYVVKNYGFTKHQNQMQSWLKNLNASGGGDYPEAAAEALRAAVNLNWRRGKGERLLFHIADAPPHRAKSNAYLRAAKDAAQKNIQVFGLGASGVAEESEFLMRQASVATGGRYLFLTDDSGVGYAHAEPSIACYRVTRLKSLLVRVLRSELSGLRKEASRSEIMREVGTYRNGACLQ